MAAASIFDIALTGCSNFVESIPCLGPAAAPTPVPGMTYIRASEIGCSLDCDLTNGRSKNTGGPAPDDGPRINAAMAKASPSHPITFIIDGGVLISGLFLPAGGDWSIAGLGCGTGFFVKTGTNNDGIHNGPHVVLPNSPGPPAPAIRGSNVSLSNFTLNGNAGNGFNGDSTSGKRQGSPDWFFGINLVNLDNITIENVVVVNTPAYHFLFSNVGNVSVSGCYMRSPGVNNDGLHFDGPANDIVISNCTFITGDDSIALNCPEGYTGSISRVKVTGCTFNSLSLMRMYTTAGGPLKFTVNDVTVSNCTGTLAETCFFLGLAPDPEPDSITSLTISDCNLAAPTVLALAENFGSIALNNVTWVPDEPDTYWSASQTNHISAFVRPSPFGGVKCTGSSISFSNCQIVRKSNIQTAAFIFEDGTSIDNVEFNGFAVRNSGSYAPLPALLNMEAGSIGNLVFNAVDPGNIQAPVESGGFSHVKTVSGPGVLWTGWSFPDAVMADRVPYISASTGRPSIKIDGVVEPYSSSGAWPS
ncbi:MAG: glycosyl hydrolase family 28 protein [Terracidiphilus sp.]